MARASDWSVFGVRPDGSWWRVFDSPPEGGIMSREWAERTADEKNREPNDWAPDARFEAHPIDWVGTGPVAIAGA